MKIHFSLLSSDTELNFVSEEELIEEIDKHRSFLSKERKPHIAKFYVEEIDTPTVEIIDEMWNITLNLCFYQVGEVLKNNKGLYKIAISMGKSISLELIKDDLVRLVIEGRQHAYKKDLFLKSLYNCGVRYLEFLNVLNDENHRKNGSYLEGYRKEVEKLLTAEGLL